MSASFSHSNRHPWLGLRSNRARLVDRAGSAAPRIAEEKGRRPGQGATTRHDDEALPRPIGGSPDPQRPSTARTKAANGAPSPAMASDDITETLQIIIAIGVAGELTVPWAVIGFSNWFVFSAPFWALGLIFAGPLTLALATALIVWLMHMRRPASREKDAPRQRQMGTR